MALLGSDMKLHSLRFSSKKYFLRSNLSPANVGIQCLNYHSSINPQYLGHRKL